MITITVINLPNAKTKWRVGHHYHYNARKFKASTNIILSQQEITNSRFLEMRALTMTIFASFQHRLFHNQIPGFLVVSRCTPYPAHWHNMYVQKRTRNKINVVSKTRFC